MNSPMKPLSDLIPDMNANCLMSWDGKNVYGDEKSILFVRQAVHDAGTVPELKERIRELQDKINQLEKR